MDDDVEHEWEEELLRLIEKGYVEIGRVRSNEYVDYTIPIKYLSPMSELLQSLSQAKEQGVDGTKMEEEQKKAMLPEWDNIEANKPKMKWEINQTQEVTFKCSKPRDIIWKDPKEGDKRIFIFEVMNEGKEKVIMTDAKSLVQGIKSLGADLMNKVALITKNVKGSKQFYEVHEADMGE